MNFNANYGGPSGERRKLHIAHDNWSSVLLILFVSLCPDIPCVISLQAEARVS